MVEGVGGLMSKDIREGNRGVVPGGGDFCGNTEEGFDGAGQGTTSVTRLAIV